MKTLAALALILALVESASAEESGTLTATDLLISYKPTVTLLLQINNGDKEVLSVTPEGIVRLNGVEVDKLNTEEAKVAWLALAKYLLKEQARQGESYAYLNVLYELRERERKLEECVGLVRSLKEITERPHPLIYLKERNCTERCHGK